jgi:outer membrane cobalamin receptor
MSISRLLSECRSGLALLLLVLVVACAPARTSRGSVDSQLITEDEIEASRAPNAYEVIQKLRANFLTYRGETSFNKSNSQPYPTVYIDGQEFGPISSLRNIPASQVATIRLYRSWEATTKYGTGNMGGVIAVTTRQ